MPTKMVVSRDQVRVNLERVGDSEIVNITVYDLSPNPMSELWGVYTSRGGGKFEIKIVRRNVSLPNLHPAPDYLFRYRDGFYELQIEVPSDVNISIIYR